MVNLSGNLNTENRNKPVSELRDVYLDFKKLYSINESKAINRYHNVPVTVFGVITEISALKMFGFSFANTSFAYLQNNVKNTVNVYCAFNNTDGLYEETRKLKVGKYAKIMGYFNTRKPHRFDDEDQSALLVDCTVVFGFEDNTEDQSDIFTYENETIKNVRYKVRSLKDAAQKLSDAIDILNRIDEFYHIQNTLETSIEQIEDKRVLYSKMEQHAHDLLNKMGCCPFVEL